MSLEEVQKLLPYSCKIEADQKCLKISTHSHHEVRVKAVEDAIWMFVRAKELLEADGFKVAPL